MSLEHMKVQKLNIEEITFVYSFVIRYNDNK